MQATFTLILMPLLYITIIVILQVKLSQCTNKWLGLILPIISFGFSLLTVISLLLFIVIPPISNLGVALFHALMIFIITNIPTIILLAIYRMSREKQKKNKELEKMNIQDLK